MTQAPRWRPGHDRRASDLVTTLRQDAAEWMEAELPPFTAETLPAGEKRFERLAKMVKQHQHATFAYDNPDGALMVDVQTANLLVMVAKALNPTNRAKFLSMDLGSMVSVAWKLVA